MRTVAIFTLAAVLVLASGVEAGGNLDLTDFDDEVMRSMDDQVKSLDSDIATHNAGSAAADAQSIEQGLKWAEGYFSKKGSVPDAVKLARQAEDLAASLARSAASSDFDGALETYDTLVKTCRTCHDAYKPPDL